MKLLLVTTIFPPQIGGPARQVWDFARVVNQKTTIKPVILTFGHENTQEKKNDIPVYRSKNFHNIPAGLGTVLRQANFISQLVKVIKREKIDLIHCQEIAVLGLATGIVGRILNCPRLVKYPGDLVYENFNKTHLQVKNVEDIFDKNFLTKTATLIERFIILLYDRIWATSIYQSNILQKFLKIPKEKILLMPNFINLKTAIDEDFQKKEKKDLIKILLVSRLVPWKQVEKIEKILNNLDNLPIKTIVVGSGNEEIERKLKTLAAKEKMKNKIFFQGGISPEKIDEKYQEADLFLSLTAYEPFGISFVEAAAAGLPVVAPKIGGIPEVVEDGQTGFLYEAENWQMAAKKIKQLINDKRLYNQMSQRAKEKAKKFDLSENLKKVMAFYKAVSHSNKAC